MAKKRKGKIPLRIKIGSWKLQLSIGADPDEDEEMKRALKNIKGKKATVRYLKKEDEKYTPEELATMAKKGD